MELPRFALDFLRDALQLVCHTAWLLVGRKNGKSQALASLVLAYLADGGPLRRAGFRCAIVSVTKPKANELKKLAQDTAEASGLRGLTFPRSPAPGRIVSRWGTCEILSASDYEGHASGIRSRPPGRAGTPSRTVSGAHRWAEVLTNGAARAG